MTEEIRDGYLGDLPEELRIKVMAIHKMIVDACNAEIKRKQYDDIRDLPWAKEMLNEFLRQPKDKDLCGSVRVYKKGKRYRCMIQVTGHPMNNRNTENEEYFHGFIRNVHTSLKGKVRKQFDVALTCESEHGENFEGFDIWTKGAVAKCLWENKFADKKTKIERPEKIYESLEYVYAGVDELPWGLQSQINGITESLNTTTGDVYCLIRRGGDTSGYIELGAAPEIILKDAHALCEMVNDSCVGKILSIADSYTLHLESEYADKLATWMNINDTFEEGSHGLLKFDFRLGWDAETGHQVKVVYSLKNINITDVGDFYYNYAGKKVGATHDSHLDYTRKNIARRGNTDHQSTGQKVLAIIDMVTKKRLPEVNLLNPFCRYIDTHAMSQTPENLKAANAYAASNPDSKVHLKVGEVDNTKTYKTTTWAKGNTTDGNGEDFRFQQIASSEELKDGRGWKIHNIIPKRFKLVGQNDGGFVFKQNPTKEEALKELEVRREDTNRMINYISGLIAKGNNDPRAKDYLEWLKKNNDNIQKDYITIKSGSYDVSMMKKYREEVEYTESYIESFMDSTPPAHDIEYMEGGSIDMDTEIIFEAAKEPDNNPEYNTNMTPAAAKRTLGTASASVIQSKKANQYTADIYANIITKNLLGTWAKGYRKLSITLDPKLKGSVFEFKIPNMTLDFVSRFVDGREPINGLLHRIPEIKIRMSEGAFKTIQNRDDAFNFFRAAVKYYDTGVIRYSERIMTEIMKLPTEMKRLISSTKLSGIVTLPIQMLFSFDDVDMSSTTTFNISKEDINTVTKFIRSIYSNYASPEKEKQKIISDLQNVVYHLKESCELDENKVAVTAITEGVSEWYSGKMNTQLDKYRAEFEYENVDAEAMTNAHHELKMLYESTKMKKLKKIPRDLVAYITIETESIRDANDKMMIASYCLSKLEIVEWYIELLEVGSKKYIVPHSLPYLQSLRTQLLQCYNNIMKVKIVRPNERPLIKIDYPAGYTG